jgi:hypothetical protein
MSITSISSSAGTPPPLAPSARAEKKAQPAPPSPPELKAEKDLVPKHFAHGDEAREIKGSKIDIMA